MLDTTMGCYSADAAAAVVVVGSEYDSDENLDIPEEEDILMEEEGDKDIDISEEELRNQVGRVHM